MKERWFKNHRMEWIAESLRVYGFINREHIMTKFGISMPQASKDMMEYQRLNPTALRYDVSLKKYIANTKDS
jgi:hypothetical protein